MQALEHLEDPFAVLRIEANAIISDGQVMIGGQWLQAFAVGVFPLQHFCGNIYLGSLTVFGKFNSIGNEVGKYLLYLVRDHLHRRQRRYGAARWFHSIVL